MLEGRKHTLWPAAVVAAALLSACSSSTQDVLEPSAIATPSGPATASTGPQPGNISSPPTQAAAIPPQNSAAVTSARVHIAPIVGTSVTAASSLSDRLAARASQRGIRMIGASDQTATHMLKGYFTPLVEGKETTVIYVWDVYDPSGNRIHRISGQQKSPSAGGFGWDAVPAASMQAIGDATINQLATWLSGASG